MHSLFSFHEYYQIDSLTNVISSLIAFVIAWGIRFLLRNQTGFALGASVDNRSVIRQTNLPSAHRDISTLVFMFWSMGGIYPR